MTHRKAVALEPLSPKEERVLSKTLRKVFLTAFSNPDRQGCPGHSILETLVFQRRDLSREERERWFSHMAHCSPCYKEFLSFRREYVKKRRIKQSAAILLLLGLSSWIYFKMPSWVGSRQPSIVKAPQMIPPPPPGPSTVESPFQTALLDIRDQGVARGPEPRPVYKRFTLPRARLHLTVYLWIGSDIGPYEFQLRSPSGESLAKVSGKGTTRKGIGTVLEVDLDTSRLSPGKYLVQIREPDRQWSKFEVRIE